MRRVLVIGSGGAGKSTFATALAKRTGLPLVHLDSLYWSAGWVETPKAEWARTVERLVAEDRWVMDGNYGGTLEVRLAACDTVVMLDLPRSVCLWRVVKRRFRYRNRPRPDMAEGCEERFSWDFVRWVWSYPVERRGKILERLSRLEPEQRAVILRSSAEVAEFLRAVCDTEFAVGSKPAQARATEPG